MITKAAERSSSAGGFVWALARKAANPRAHRIAHHIGHLDMKMIEEAARASSAMICVA